MFEQPPNKIEDPNNENPFETQESAIDRWNDFRAMKEEERARYLNNTKDPEAKEAAMNHFGAFDLFEDILNKLGK